MAEAQLASAADLARDIEEGLASATTATERAALVPEELTRAIDTLKAERDAVILAHYYVSPEVQAVADYVLPGKTRKVPAAADHRFMRR